MSSSPYFSFCSLTYGFIMLFLGKFLNLSSALPIAYFVIPYLLLTLFFYFISFRHRVSLFFNFLHFKVFLQNDSLILETQLHYQVDIE